MSRDGAGDGVSLVEDEVHVDGDLGGAVRIGRSGLAFVVGEHRVPSFPGSPASVPRPGDVAEVARTAEQLSDKLSAAEARRDSLISDMRNRCSDHNNKVQKSREQRTLSEKRQIEEAMATLQTKLDNAQANQDEQREALLEKLKKQEARHAEIRNRQVVDFEERLRQLDAKYMGTDGIRHQLLAEMVDKLKEHNERVQSVHDAIIGQRIGEEGGKVDVIGSPATSAMAFERATNEREDYMNKALSRLSQENLQLQGDEVMNFDDGPLTGA